MRIKANINGQPFVLDYATNGCNQVCHVEVLAPETCAVVTDWVDTSTLTEAWALARQHHTRAQAAEVAA